MKIKLFNPEHQSLKSCVRQYYVLNKANDDDEISYLTFPNPYSIVSLMDKVKLHHSQNKMYAEFKEDEPLVSDLTLSYKEPILISYKGTIKEITISFQPLGIHSFLAQSEAHNIEKAPFFPYADYEQKMTQIISLDDEKEMVDQIEHYLLSKFTPFKHPFLFDFIADVSIDTEVSLSDLSKKYGVTQKTLIKHSKTYLHRTPSEYKRVVRFRKALDQYIHSTNSDKSFTDISHAVSFFDQAHMIKDFKALTGYTPSKFFKKLNSNGVLNWIFV